MDDPSVDSFSLVHDPRIAMHSNLNSDSSSPAKLLYSKSKVYIHPSANSADAIPGYLSVVEQASRAYLVAWTPEALIPSKDMEAFVQVDCNPEDSTEEAPMIPSIGYVPEEYALYAISSPLQEIHSLLIRPPSLTKWYGSVILNFKDGHSSAPLWFHDDESKSTMLQKKTQGGKFADDDNQNTSPQIRWGGDEFVDRLSQLTSVVRAAHQPLLYWVGKKEEPKEQEFSEKGEQSHVKEVPAQKINEKNKAEEPKASVFESAQMDPIVAALKEARWSILERLSRVTKFSRDTAVSILGHPSSRPIVAMLPPEIQEMCNNETVKQTIDDYDSARIYLAKWAAGLAAQSEQSAPVETRYRHVGVWGHDGWEEDTALGVFEVLNSENDFSIPTHTRTSPITRQQWDSFFNESGRLSVGEPFMRRSIFCGGLDPSVRHEAWLFLTGVYSWNSTKEERATLLKQKKAEYAKLKSQWADNEEYQKDPTFQDQKHRIGKDVHRTDRTVPMYANEDMPNPDPLMHVGTNQNLETLKDILCTYNIHNTELGYVQGMSDLLSPLYAVLEDEALSFWAFVGFMNRMKSNFFMDQSGMHKQLLTLDGLLQFMDPSLYKHFERTDSDNLFFCFRWLLVWFKREFAWDDTLRLWEVLWTDYLTDQFHLFVAVSILDQHRDVIIDYLKNFDEVLKYINDLSMTIDLKETLQRAEIIFYQFKQRVEAVENKRDTLKKTIGQRKNTPNEHLEDKLPIVNELLKGLLKSQTQGN
ncbi:putative GTPase activating protein [Phycomyces blakesleeanus]|uniref:GTPase activating protein n=1 Tax=Phycomyces blakesleeanus TaxID=4837 RepID=A0ABR3B3Z4_PHYBL